MRKLKYQAWVLIGIFLFTLYITKNQFLGALLTTCENTEPGSLEEWQASLSILHGSAVITDPYSLSLGSETVYLPRYLVESDIGQFEIVVVEGISCSDVLAIESAQDESTESFSVDGKTVINPSKGTLWCNEQNNLLYITQDKTVVSEFVDFFTVCTTVETDDEEPSASSSTTAATSTPTPTAEIVTTEPTKDHDLQYVLLILAVEAAGIAYFIFEAGPNKGLIRKRKKR